MARPGALADSPGPRAPQLSSRPGPRLLERLPPKNMVARRWLSTSRRVLSEIVHVRQIVISTFQKGKQHVGYAAEKSKQGRSH